MSAPHLIMWLVVFAVGVPSSWKNPTAFALVLSWMAGEVVWLISGNSLPLSVYFMADIAVIAVIYAKSIARCGPKIYPSIWDQLRCLITEPSKCDRAIVAIFLLGMWPAYVTNIHPYYKWWLLWGLAIAQFLLAAAEAISLLRRDFRERADSEPSGNGFALAGASRGYG